MFCLSWHILALSWLRLGHERQVSSPNRIPNWPTRAQKGGLKAREAQTGQLRPRKEALKRPNQVGQGGPRWDKIGTKSARKSARKDRKLKRLFPGTFPGTFFAFLGLSWHYLGYILDMSVRFPAQDEPKLANLSPERRPESARIRS